MDEDDLVSGGSNNSPIFFSVGQIKYAKYEYTKQVDDIIKKGKKTGLQEAWEQKKFFDGLDQIVAEKLERPANLSLLEKETAMAIAQGATEEKIEHIWEEAYGQVRVNANGKISGGGGTQKRKRESADLSAQPAPAEEEKFLTQWEQNLNEIFEKATEPLRAFAGAVTTQLGLFDARKVQVWKNDNEDRNKIVKSGAKTVEEFVKLNKDLGALVLLEFAPDAPAAPAAPASRGHQEEEEDEEEEESSREITYGASPRKKMFSLLGAEACFDLDRADGLEDAANRALEARRGKLGKGASKYDADIFNAIRIMRRDDREMLFAPAWVYETMGNPVFYRLYSDGMVGAIRLAHSQITRIPNCRDFTIKELICSSEVMDMFAFKVATTWMASNAGAIGRGRKTTYENINESNRILAFKIEQCLVFFESVFRVPSQVRAKYDQQLPKLEAYMKHNRLPYDAEKMRKFRTMLPQWELVYRE